MSIVGMRGRRRRGIVDVERNRFRRRAQVGLRSVERRHA
jgi:hypothetical protein